MIPLSVYQSLLFRFCRIRMFYSFLGRHKKATISFYTRKRIIFVCIILFSNKQLVNAKTSSIRNDFLRKSRKSGGLIDSFRYVIRNWEFTAVCYYFNTVCYLLLFLLSVVHFLRKRFKDYSCETNSPPLEGLRVFSIHFRGEYEQAPSLMTLK